MNEYESVLSVLQSIEITTRVETFDYARNAVGSPLPFDCYGVWRKEYIEECGGWHTNTGDEGMIKT